VKELTPGFEQFLRHAHLFGTELVIETAAQLLPERELARLRVEIDPLSRRIRRRFGPSPRRRRSTEETMLAAVDMRKEGLVIGLIAEKLAITERTVKALLARHRREQRESAPQQGEKQVPDAPSRPSETAWLSGENAAETAETANDLHKPPQPQSQEPAPASAKRPRTESQGDPPAEGGGR
jgi:hypothetical protein